MVLTEDRNRGVVQFNSLFCSFIPGRYCDCTLKQMTVSFRFFFNSSFIITILSLGAIQTMQLLKRRKTKEQVVTDWKIIRLIIVVLYGLWYNAGLWSG